MRLIDPIRLKQSLAVSAILEDKKTIEQIIDEQPTIEERKTGRWIPQDRNKKSGNTTTCVYYYPVCSECGHTGDFNMNFCPNCGADMRGETE